MERREKMESEEKEGRCERWRWGGVGSEFVDEFEEEWRGGRRSVDVR